MGSDSGEFQDWEVLHSNSDSESGFGDLDAEEIDAHSDGVVFGNYFSVESGEGQFPKFISEESSRNSENPGWIEPVSEFQSPRKESAEFLSDSGNIEDGEPKFTESRGSSEVGVDENEELFMGNKENEEITSENETKSDGNVKAGDFEENREQSLKDYTRSDVVESESLDVNVEVETRNVEEAEKKKTVVWWKVPLELLKYCGFRVNPVWTFSLAAAAMGFLILGRRLYNMKKRARSMQTKVTMDDKKVSQFMSRAARLNEAFSVVKRVPVIRPALPTVGVTPWPVMSLR